MPQQFANDYNFNLLIKDISYFVIHLSYLVLLNVNKTTRFLLSFMLKL